MLRFFKNINPTTQRYKLFLFYCLNLYDILFTQFFVFKLPDLFEEVNPFLAPIISDYQSLLLKIIIPLLVLIYWDKRYKTATEKERKRANIVMNLLLIIFICINALHLFNMAFYIAIQ